MRIIDVSTTCAPSQWDCVDVETIRVADTATNGPSSYRVRIEAIRATKMAQIQQKQEAIGAMHYDDWALVLPPEDVGEVVEACVGCGWCGLVPDPDLALERANRLIAEVYGQPDWVSPSTDGIIPLTPPWTGWAHAPTARDAHDRAPCVETLKWPQAGQEQPPLADDEACAGGGPLLCPQGGRTICRSLTGPEAFLERRAA